MAGVLGRMKGCPQSKKISLLTDPSSSIEPAKSVSHSFWLLDVFAHVTLIAKEKFLMEGVVCTFV